jgi:hypothetical protein
MIKNESAIPILFIIFIFMVVFVFTSVASSPKKDSTLSGGLHHSVFAYGYCAEFDNWIPIQVDSNGFVKTSKEKK